MSLIGFPALWSDDSPTEVYCWVNWASGIADITSLALPWHTKLTLDLEGGGCGYNVISMTTPYQLASAVLYKKSMATNLRNRKELTTTIHLVCDASPSSTSKQRQMMVAGVLENNQSSSPLLFSGITVFYVIGFEWTLCSGCLLFNTISRIL